MLKEKDLVSKRARLLFLRETERAQFDPDRPLFVPLRELMMDDDAEFCSKHGRVPVAVFNEFLKTM